MITDRKLHLRRLEDLRKMILTVVTALRSDSSRVVGIVASYPQLAMARAFVTGQAWSAQPSFPSLYATPYVVRRSSSSRTALESFQGANSAQLCFTTLKIRELVQIYHDWPLSPNGEFASPLMRAQLPHSRRGPCQPARHSTVATSVATPQGSRVTSSQP